jgi:hypothetical protein
MLVDELRMPVTPQENAEIIKPCDDALQLHAIDEKDREWRLIFANVIEESILQALHALGSHDGPHFFVFLYRVKKPRDAPGQNVCP